ncbi:MAG TPA: L-histidine N(alpha)-methyltransferase [Nitrospirales bacterium]|nr:L-histidine N(alpha)-methyltransferase [Nitrospirales bacterium]
MTSQTDPSITIDLPLTREDPDLLKTEITRGLLANPKTLPSKLFYDERGSTLFEQICELPEYYQTRTEHQLLTRWADEIVGISEAEELVELGSGAATKTRVLLDAMANVNQLRYFVPFDVDEAIVRRVSEELVREYPGLHIHGVVGDFLVHLEHIPEGGKRLVVILGGTIGNLPATAAHEFLSSVNSEMAPGDYFLLGVQLITDRNRLEAAYNDQQGITAKFNKNIIRVLHNQFGSQSDSESFDHVARYNEADHRIEMWLRSREDQTLGIQDLNLKVHLKQGEEIRTEISTKYDRPLAEELLASSGFALVKWYSDPDSLIGLALAKKP